MPLAGLYSSSFLLCALVLQAQDRPDEVEHLRYHRSIVISGEGPNCVILDGAMLAHAAGSLRDIRAYSGRREVAYAIAVNEAAEVESEMATVLNLREEANAAVFDLAMPERAYTQLIFQLEGADFVAEAKITGSNELGNLRRVPLGTYALFDMTSKGLSRNTRVSLQESSFRFLHVRLRGEGFRLKGVEVPPNRDSQTLFTPVAETRVLTQRGSETIATFRIPAKVPVERVSIRLDPGFHGNFSRIVHVSATADSKGSLRERVTGKVMRVRSGAISVDEEAFRASLGANLQSDATVKVAIENEGQPALPVTAVALSMRQRTLCLDAPGPVDLYYGDQLAASPRLRYEAPTQWQMARLGPEGLNAAFRERRERPMRPLRLPGWASVLGVLLAGGVLGFTVRQCLRRRALKGSVT